MKLRIKKIITTAICISSIASPSACAIWLNTEKMVRDAEGPLSELVRKIREENLPAALQDIGQALQGAQKNLEIVTKSACRNLLYLGCGIAGLSILTATVIMPIISQFRSSSRSDTPRTESTKRRVPPAIGLCSGIALLVGSYFGLRQ